MSSACLLLLRITSTALKSLVPHRLLYFMLTTLQTHNSLTRLKMLIAYWSTRSSFRSQCVYVGTSVHTCSHWHVVAGGGRIQWRRLCWQSLFVKGSERETHHINFHTNITLAMGRFCQRVCCYVQSLPSGPDHSSNRHNFTTQSII
jgi:hypothetical protein